MLWKAYRLRKRSSFQEIIKKGFVIKRKNFIIYYLTLEKITKKKDFNKDANHCLFGISTPKNILKKANDRNYRKRQIKEILIYFIKEKDKCNKKKDKHYGFIIIMKKSFLKQSFNENKNNLHEILNSLYDNAE